MKISVGKNEILFVAILVILSFILRYAFFSVPGCEVDLNTFAYWFRTAALSGPRTFYSAVIWCDYPPFNVYIFWIFGSAAQALSLFGTTSMPYLIKLVPSLFDAATTVLIFFFLRKTYSFKMSFLASGLYAFNPAVIYNAAVWGQFDAIYSFFLFLSLFFLLDSKPKWAVVAFIIGVLTKPQSIALAPLIVFLIFKKYHWKGLAVSLAVGVATVVAVIIPFEWSNPVTFLSDIYFGAYQGYKFTTVNAFNLWGFGGMWRPDTTLYFLLGWGMFAAVALFTLYLVDKRFGKANELYLVVFGAFVLFFAFFMLPTRIHERYIFPALGMLALLFPFIKQTRPAYIVLTGTCLVNQAYALMFLNTNQFISPSDPVAFTVSLINLVMLVYILILMRKELRGKGNLNPVQTEASANTPGKG